MIISVFELSLCFLVVLVVYAFFFFFPFLAFFWELIFFKLYSLLYQFGNYAHLILFFHDYPWNSAGILLIYRLKLNQIIIPLLDNARIYIINSCPLSSCPAPPLYASLPYSIFERFILVLFKYHNKMLLLLFYSDNVYLDLFVCLLISLLIFSFLHLRSSLCVILLFYETCPLDIVEVNVCCR